MGETQSQFTIAYSALEPKDTRQMRTETAWVKIMEIRRKIRSKQTRLCSN